ncbi:c-type cytochrome [Natronospira bacteriovora]|uniref:Cytochrome c n=1 Tax=Natronospira bacteriovora TaxID=3069753 RepID=A0ABU0W8U9_9GAMM|nr:cytochrome c [Natronospira sp. AB-CW4]MDQ2070382.1 cytochrome c [Natronospira sp. AB-CW4]
MKNLNKTIPLFFAALCLGATAHAEPGDKDRGEARAATCAGCHGQGGNSSIPSLYPSIAGMPAAEMEAALKAFRDGERDDPQMAPQATHLSDQDIRDLAAYYEAQERK